MAEKGWNSDYSTNNSIAYPAEGVIRIFKGQFPQLNFEKPIEGSSIVDVGCGDGRHLSFFRSLGLEPTGVEITPDVVANTSSNLASLGIEANVVHGHAGSMPLPSDSQDILMTWISCYYMSHANTKFEDHVAEMARVIKPSGYIVASIPKPSCFIFKDTVASEQPGYRVIKDDYFGVRNGEVMRYFETAEEVTESFQADFENFSLAEIDIAWFGLQYSWYVFVAQKK